MTIDVILDVDTGVDDGLALLLALRSPLLSVRAVTCVAGNVDVDQVVRNTLTVLDQAGVGEVPVARGSERPLVEPLWGGRSRHGVDGLADLDLPLPVHQPLDVPAVEHLREVLLASRQPVTLVALGPLTNVALLIRLDPALAEHVGRIVVVGGELEPNGRLALSGFNLRQDPDATDIVLGSGLPVLVYPMDVFFGVTLDLADAEGLAMLPEPGAQLAGRLLLHQVERFGGAAGTIGDAGAVACVVDPDGCEKVRRHEQLDVVRQIDAERYRGLFVRTVVAGARARPR